MGLHPQVQITNIILAEEAARDTGLIGEDENEIAGLVQPPDRPGDAGHPANAIACTDIAVVMIDDAVAIQECRGPASRSFNGAVHFSSTLSASARSTLSQIA